MSKPIIRLKDIQLSKNSCRNLLSLGFDNGFSVAINLYTDSDRCGVIGALKELTRLIETSRQLEYTTQKEYEEAVLNEQPVYDPLGR